MDIVENATLDDLITVRGLNSLLKIIDVRNFYWDTERYVRAAIQEGRCFVIRSAHLLKGSMIVENRDPDKRYPRASLSVGIIAVHPEFRRKGLGVQLIEFAKKMAFKCRKRLYVESFFEYKKLRFYEKLGFTKDAPKRYGGKPYHVFFLDPSPVNLDGLVKSPKVRHSGESRSPEPI